MKPSTYSRRFFSISSAFLWLMAFILICSILWILFKIDLGNNDHSKPNSPVAERRPKEVNAIDLNSSEIRNSLMGMESDELMTEKTHRLIAAWARAYPTEAREWVMSINNPQLRQPLAQQVALGMAKSNPREAAGFVVSDFLPGNQQDECLVAVVGVWAKQEPEIVGEWIKEFPHDTMGGNAMGALMSTWMKQDSEAAGDWLASLPPGGLKNSGLVPYVNYLKGLDEKRAQVFIQMIDNN